jgi:hypothetical protein
MSNGVNATGTLIAVVGFIIDSDRFWRSTIFLSTDEDVFAIKQTRITAATMAAAPSPDPPASNSITDSAANVSPDELDLTSFEGLRQLQRNFITEEPRYHSVGE